MACIYTVRCNFARPDLERAWNDWYNGPKLTQMLAKPLFLSGQRFAAAGLDRRRKYLALWIVDSPDAFKTREYTSDWGFHEWQPHICDWNRDLYRSPTADATARFEIDDASALYFVAFDGRTPTEAEALRARVAPLKPNVTWMGAIGLDKHSPILGLERVKRGVVPAALSIDGVGETLFEPISACARAAVRA